MQFDKALELAVMASWDELVGRHERSHIHVEYENLEDVNVGYVRVWSVSKAGWKLVCDYIPAVAGEEPRTPRFTNGYTSARLAVGLYYALGNQDRFERHGGEHGMVQVSAPSGEERFDAAAWVATGVRGHTASGKRPADVQ